MRIADDKAPTLSQATITEVQSRFALWREARKLRERIPEDLWSAAVMLCESHSVQKISRMLRLNHSALRDRVLTHKTRQPPSPSPPQGFITIDLAVNNTVEKLAQRYSARLVTSSPREAGGQIVNGVDYQEVDVASLELGQPRSIGVEHAGLAALKELQLLQILADVGLNGVQQAAAIGSIIGRMAEPGSELATYDWLTGQSGLGELLDVDYEAIPLMRLYRTSDLLVKHRQTIESLLFSRISELFSLPTTVTLYDLTNTYFEGGMAGNTKAKRGHSKEKRTDCPLVTLGLVLDGSGLVRHSRMFEGNAVEATTLEQMLSGLAAPENALVIMDRGIATDDNIAWLKDHNYRYLVVSREKKRRFEAEQAIEITTASDKTVRVQRVLSEDGGELRLHCHSDERQDKEEAITNRFVESFERGLEKIAAALQAPRGEKRRDKIQQRIGHLQKKSRILAGQRRITAIFKQKDGRTLHVRKTTVAEPKLRQLYAALDLSASPVGVRKMAR